MGILGKKKTSKQVEVKVKDEEVSKIKLALTDEEKARMSNVQIQYLEDEIAKLPKIEDGQVNLTSEYFVYFEGKIETKVFIRNALPKSVNFEEVYLGIQDADGNLIIHQKFNLANLGDIPPYSARVTKLFFDVDGVNLDDIDFENLKICFSGGVKAFKSITTEFQELPENLPSDQVAMLNRYLEDLNQIEVNTVTLSAVDLLENEDGNIMITIIARNGYDKEIKLEEVPISVFDKNNSRVAGGKFKLEDLNVLPKKARIFNLILSKQNIIEENYDLSKWRIAFN
ncbi:SLAP domain-containing protein [Clostridium neuense]|uniref:SLAP domain-containing protein n=1 Tax=Clostridium neuense TaxID=1728934 RepID=A0ABW8TBM6_9CLOT